VVVVGGGPAGATAAHEAAQRGHSVLLLDRAGRIKPCGGAIPPRLIKDFAIPESPAGGPRHQRAHDLAGRRKVDIPIEGGFVGMVDRDTFDEWLRERAPAAGGARAQHRPFRALERDDDGRRVVVYAPAATDRAPRLDEAAPRCARAA
jgi:geranylgeranyl reductase